MYNLDTYYIGANRFSTAKGFVIMGILGKDLFDVRRPLTHIKIQFGEQGYWVEDYQEPQPYGSILTEILNYDLSLIQKQLDELNRMIAEQDRASAPRCFLDLLSLFASLPLYRFRMEDFRFFISLPVEALFVGEALEAFQDHICNRESRILCVIEKSIEEIQQIQTRYTWFLDSVFSGAEFEKKKGQKKIPLVSLMIKNNLEAMVSGNSLGESKKIDAPAVNIQYAVIEPAGQPPELVEKLYFDSLLDFVYVELMKGLQKGFIPKRCANCGTWFLQFPGATFAYCDNPAPNAEGKTCREIGATTSFKDKVKNNEVWQIHQRAYKKYFARTRKKTMSVTDFEIWSRDAERIRDDALKRYAAAGTEDERKVIAEMLKTELNQL